MAAAGDAPDQGKPLVGIVMGSRSDWETMQHAAAKLDALGVPHEVRVVSAHRTPDVLFDYAANAHSRGLRAIIAVPAVQRICRACWRPRPRCRCLACRCRARR